MVELLDMLVGENLTINSVLSQLKNITIRGEVREKRFSNRDFLQYLGYSANANKSLERLLDGEAKPSLEQLLQLERNIRNLEPSDSIDVPYKVSALEQLTALLQQYENPVNTAEVLADLATATETDLAEGKQYFERYFRQFALNTIGNLTDLRKALVGLAYHASQSCTHFKMTMTAAESVWQTTKSETMDLEREADRLARLFMRLLRHGYRKEKFEITMIWQLPQWSNDYFAKQQDQNNPDEPFMVDEKYLWLRKSLCKNFSHLRHLIPSKGERLNASVLNVKLAFSKNGNEVLFPPTTDFVCAYNEAKTVMYGGMLFSGATKLSGLKAQANSAYLISEDYTDSLIVQHFGIDQNSFNPILKAMPSHNDFERAKLQAELQAKHIYMRSYDYPTVLKSLFELQGHLGIEYKTILLEEAYPIEDISKDTDNVVEKMIERIKLFNKNVGIPSQKDIRIIMPAEAIFAFTDQKTQQNFGFEGIFYREKYSTRKFLRLQKLYALLNKFPECIAFSSNQHTDPELHTSLIFPNKTSHLITVKENKEVSAFFEKRDASVKKGNELHYQIESREMAMGALFTFQNKWTYLRGEGSQPNQARQEFQRQLSLEITKYIHAQIERLSFENPKLAQFENNSMTEFDQQ
jgi:hypothetical protein